MHVLIVEDEFGRQVDLKVAFVKAGFQVATTGSQAVADVCIRKGVVDLLVIAERVGGRLTHALSLLAECRNPMVETILLTPRSDADIEELFELLPSLHCILAPDLAPNVITKLAVAAIKGAKASAEKNSARPLLLTPDCKVAIPSAKISHFTSSRRAPGPAVQLQEFA